MRSEQGPEKRPVLEIGEGDSKENRKNVRGRKEDLILNTVERNCHTQTTRKHAVGGGS